MTKQTPNQAPARTKPGQTRRAAIKRRLADRRAARIATAYGTAQ